jgi:hypothetical protein
MMPSKPMPPEHCAWLDTLIEQYDASRLIKLIKKGKVTSQPGRPTEYRGNLLEVYRYVEHNSKRKTSAGRLLGVSGACDSLNKLLVGQVVNFDLTPKRLRQMYYEAIKGKKAFSAAELAAARAQPYSNEQFPLLFKRNSDGTFNVMIDTWAGDLSHSVVRK